MALASVNRLRKERDITTVLREGKTVRGSFFILKVHQRSEKQGENRFATIVASRVAGTSVVRNTIKRKTTEVFRSVQLPPRGLDITCSIKMVPGQGRYQELQEALKGISR